MKKSIVFLFMIICTTINGQWYSSIENDPFDGKVIYTTGIGKGGKFPYNNPRLVFRRKGKDIDIYIKDAGSLVCDNPELKISFGDPSNTLKFNLFPSVDSSAGFLNMNNVEVVSDFISQLKNKSTVYIRFRTDCSTNQFQISLKGSSKEINKVYTDDQYIKLQSKVEERQKQEKEKRDRMQQYAAEQKEKLIKIDESINRIFKKLLTNHIFSQLDELNKSNLEEHLRSLKLGIEKIDSISLKLNRSRDVYLDYNVDAFEYKNGVKEKLNFLNLTLSKNSDLIKRENEEYRQVEIRRKEFENKIKLNIEKAKKATYKYNSITLTDKILNEISKQKYRIPLGYGFKDIKIIFFKPKKGKIISELKLILIFNEKTYRESVNWNIRIEKKDLKLLGVKYGEAF